MNNLGARTIFTRTLYQFGPPTPNNNLIHELHSLLSCDASHRRYWKSSRPALSRSTGKSSTFSTMEASQNPDPSKDEQYASSEDEDFNPTNAEAGEEDISSSSDDDASQSGATKARRGTSKRKHVNEDDLDSGDEVTIRQSGRKKKRKADKDEDDDSGGEGGLIKTRAQRRAEYVGSYSRHFGLRAKV